MKIQNLYEIYCKCGCRVTTDTRTLSGGELFFALKGESFDGNEYALAALEGGAAYAVVDSLSPVAASCADNPRVIPVEDTLRTLQELARWHRSMTFVDGKPLTVIALTGTNGKTTTKELIRQVLSVKYRVTATEGNLNNSIGVPLTLLRINGETQIAVVEMGASHPGDIRELVEIALPNYGLVTNVGKAHLLGFGSLEGVMATKGELYDYLRRTSDKVFINVDNPLLCKMASDRNLQSDPERPYSLLLPYGLEYQGASVMPSSPEHPYLRLSIPDSDGSLVLVQTSLVGSYNADNVMAAIAVGRHFGISLKEAALAIESYVPSNNRSQMMRTEKNRLIVDAYNANPTSMTAALDNFASVSAPSKVALLGDMLELGTESVAEHVAIAKKALSLGLSKVCFVGAEFGKALQIIRKEQEELCDAAMHFDSSDSLKSYLDANPLEDALVLVKGSRGTRMEKTIQSL
ncbi:MAG: UDP-N-acetylmuramoyl-tripeptide--D-alanyl-D-alanine ligase [Candidatus Cryptobacteroides sp.]|nr:UDP-N-acetylmuramoyl-tripeptide--D-alanyl-D-alanine ligase [Candidatus Cryptobacteroides sp.]